MRKSLKMIALVLASSAAGLLLVELLVRLFIPQPLFMPRGDVWAPVDTFGYRHPPNADTNVDVYGPTVHFVTDGDGYRINTIKTANACKPDKRILFLGDSFVEGLKVEEDQTIPELTKQILENKYALCVHVDNSGVSGWNPNHYLIEARRALERHRYDAGVVILYLGNDLLRARTDSFPPRPPTPHHTLRLPKNLGAKELVDAIVKPINDYLRSRSHSFMMLKTRIRRFTSRPAQERYFPDFLKKSAVDSPGWDLTASVCRDIRNEFDKRGLPVFFVFLPVFYQVSVDVFHEYVERCGIDPDSVDVDQPQVLLGRAFAAQGLDVLDPLDVMREQARNGILMYKGWDPHFSVEGNLFLAGYVAPIIAASLPEKREF